MIPGEWTATEWVAYKAALPLSTQWDISVQVRDLSHNHLADLSTYGMDGQWNIVGDGDVDRTLQMSLLDIDGAARTHLNPDVAPKRLVYVRQGTWVASLSKWLWVPVFMGRPAVSKDDGDTLTIEAQGKECLHLRGVPAGSIRKGQYVVDAIRDGLRAAGETRLSIPTSSAIRTKIARDVPIGGSDPTRMPWLVWQRLAKSVGCQLFYDGWGRAVVRKWPASSQVTVEWDSRTVLSRPQASTDMTSLRNRWVGGGKGTLYASDTATGTFSPAQMAFGGVSWSNTEYAAENDSLTTQAELAAHARSQLAAALTLGTDLSCDVVPFHAVDPSDWCRVVTPDGNWQFRMSNCSVPLIGQSEGGGTGWPMTLGYHKRVRRSSPGRARTRGSARPKRKRK